MLLAVAVGSGCTDGADPASESPSSEPSRATSTLCDAAAAIDWEAAAPTASDSDDQVRSIFQQASDDARSLAAAASGATRETAERVLNSGDAYRSEYLEQRAEAGGGRALSELARSNGFSSTRQFVEARAFDDPAAVDADWRSLSATIAAECDGLHPLDAPTFATEDAPDGEVLAVRLGTDQIHRFATDGRDLGTLALPSEVEAPLRYLTLSPDGRRLAFLSGGAAPALWTYDLESGSTTTTTPPTCMDWSEDSTTLWALVDMPPNDFVARINTDGTFDRGSTIDTVGCPYRLDSTALAMSTSPIDGAPAQIDRVPFDNGPVEELIASPCNLASPQISPDAERLLVTVGCRTDVASGVYLAAADGSGFEQIVRGPAAAATWSPDGRWVAFAAPGPDGQFRVVLTEAASSGERAIGSVTPAGYSWPIWTTA